MSILPRDKRQRPHSSKLRNEATPQEKRLWFDFLRTASPQWNRQRIIGDYIVDFFCRRARLVVELDGKQHYDRNGLIEYDTVRTAFLEALGLRVIRVRNEELDQSFSDVCRKIQAAAEQRLQEELSAHKT